MLGCCGVVARGRTKSMTPSCKQGFEGTFMGQSL